ncbi:MAG: type II toxin-antitoxin system HigB family toxin [Thauera sp.]|uniref:type II toxin-antitoxin system HigB family toxin n=1 Tax=Thauera terpenica TaxID=76113 RepID=UPI000B496D33|nr:type II toxin-antitoxin system HigB family toxin [Thauera sp.]
MLKNRRVVFNIKGNDYRLIVTIVCRLQAVYVKFVVTHKGYDEVDAETVWIWSRSSAGASASTKS